ncbi:MAG: hypothetical protein ACYDAR_04395 [Thermomicrobiales bacterium]
MSTSDAVSVAWWRELANRACILEYAFGDQTVTVAAELDQPLDANDETGPLHFRVYPVNTFMATALPTEVRLLTIVGGSSCIFGLRVHSWTSEFVVVDATPLSMTQRPLRRFPRTPYQLGPCTAVVHSAIRQWRGLVEFWVHDVSSQGIGFAVVAAHADRVAVGDYLRAPVTLPDGERSWIDGEVIWLTTDGRGGLLTRRAPEWRAEPETSTSLAFT